MPGTIVFKPIEANLNHDADLIGKADPYCMFMIGDQKIKGQVCKSGGKHPIWEDAVTVPAGNQTTCVVEIKDKDILKDDKLGTVEIDLREVESQGRLKKWYPIFHKDKPAGEILMEAIYSPGGYGQGAPYQSQGMQMQGMPMQGMPIQAQGMPMQSYGMPMGQNIIGGAPGSTVTQTQVYAKETIIPIGIPNLIQSQPLGAGMIPANMTQSAYSAMNESYSDQYAREALIRGVDPLGTHLNQYPPQISGNPGFIGNNAIPQNNLGYSGGMNMPLGSNLGGMNAPQLNQQYPNQQAQFGQGLGQNIQPNRF